MYMYMHKNWYMHKKLFSHVTVVYFLVWERLGKRPKLKRHQKRHNLQVHVTTIKTIIVNH